MYIITDKMKAINTKHAAHHKGTVIMYGGEGAEAIQQGQQNFWENM